MVSEKVGGAEGTKLDEDFKDLERVRGKSGDPALYSWHYKSLKLLFLCAFPTPQKYNRNLLDIYIHCLHTETAKQHL